MPNRIVSAKPLPGCCLKVSFTDGVSGVFTVEPERRGGVFMKLLDEKIFNAVSVNSDFGCVEWPGGIDLCPDAMHQTITGSKSGVERSLAGALREESKPPKSPKSKA